jgi:hypothetical protein
VARVKGVIKAQVDKDDILQLPTSFDISESIQKGFNDFPDTPSVFLWQN